MQPDMLVVRLDETGDVAMPIQPRDLLFAIEVLSDRTPRTDRQDKRSLYQTGGVGEYWIVDADAWVVERWRPGDERPEILSNRLDWQSAGADEPLMIELPAFFATVIPTRIDGQVEHSLNSA